MYNCCFFFLIFFFLSCCGTELARKGIKPKTENNIYRNEFPLASGFNLHQQAFTAVDEEERLLNTAITCFKTNYESRHVAPSSTFLIPTLAPLSQSETGPPNPIFNQSKTLIVKFVERFAPLGFHSNPGPRVGLLRGFKTFQWTCNRGIRDCSMCWE